MSDGELHDWWYDTDPPSREVVAPVFMKTVEGAVRGTEFDYTNPALVNAAGEKTLPLIRYVTGLTVKKLIFIRKP